MEHNRLTSGELLSNDQRAVDFVSSESRFSELNFCLIRLCTFSFLALLVNKSNKLIKNLQNIAKLKRKASRFCSKNVQN